MQPQKALSFGIEVPAFRGLSFEGDSGTKYTFSHVGLVGLVQLGRVMSGFLCPVI